MSGAGTLDRVAGPVGEALIMTGLGLAVAIPAVVAYNWLTRANRVLLSRLDAFAYEVHTFVAMGQPLAAPGGRHHVRAWRRRVAAEQGADGLRQLRFAAQRAPVAEINMVPLIDVMLVLLVIFIVTAPLLTHAVKLELPRQLAGQPGQDRQGRVRDRRERRCTERRARLARGRQHARLRPPASSSRAEIHLRADQAVPYKHRRPHARRRLRAGLPPSWAS